MYPSEPSEQGGQPKGSFINYVDQIIPNFDTKPPPLLLEWTKMDKIHTLPFVTPPLFMYT